MGFFLPKRTLLEMQKRLQLDSVKFFIVSPSRYSIYNLFYIYKRGYGCQNQNCSENVSYQINSVSKVAFPHLGFVQTTLTPCCI